MMTDAFYHRRERTLIDLLLGFSYVVPNVKVSFNSSSLQAHKIWIRFGFCFTFFVLSLVQFNCTRVQRFDGVNFFHNDLSNT